ncbi:MAG: hypothetical protein CMP20_01560 [Rickettsiales bacterium]|nr:hypothetical protein [Rickettsiales bacterium]
MRFVLVLLILAAAFCDADRVRVNIRDNRFYRAAVAVGSPRQFIWAFVDFERSDLVVSQSVAQESKTYNSIDGYEFLVLDNADPLYLPTSVAGPNDANLLLGTDTFMVLGLGPGSPLWRFYRCITFTGAYIDFDKHACKCNTDDVLIRCDVDQGLDPSSLCVSSGAIGLQSGAFETTRTTFFERLRFPASVYHDLRFRSKSFQDDKDKLAKVAFDNGLALSSDVYLLQTDNRRIFRASLSPDNSSALSADIVLDWQLKFDHRLQTICATKAPITLHTSVFYAFLTMMFALALPCWYFIDEPHTGAYLPVKNRNLSQTHPFGTVSAATIVALTVILVVDFATRSELWHFPLPDREWLLPFFMTLQCVGALAAVVWLLRVGKRPWAGQTLLIETSIWLGIWLTQTNATRGTWDLLGASLAFSVFYFVWWQHLWIMILVAYWKSKLASLAQKLGDPKRSLGCPTFVAKASKLCTKGANLRLSIAVLGLLTVVHTYFLARWILTPLFASLANFGFVVGISLTSVTLPITIYTSLWLAKDHLQQSLTPDSKKSE